jgi:hypothetical protein
LEDIKRVLENIQFLLEAPESILKNIEFALKDND